MSETWFSPRHLPSFTLALSTLQEEPEPLSTATSSAYLNNDQSSRSSSSDRLMKTVDRRSERYFEYPVSLQIEDEFDDYDDYASEIETEVEYYESTESVTVYEVTVPKLRFMFFRRLAWRMLRRCPDCGEKLGPLDLKESNRLQKKRKGWISSTLSSSSYFEST